jgi:cold-inducible RNA-binding protein
MNTRLFVGNLPWKVRDEELAELFRSHGEVKYAHVVLDRDSGRSRGFGFVEMADESGAQIALEVMQGMRLEGRELRLDLDNKQHDRAPREDRGGPRRDGPRRDGPRRDGPRSDGPRRGGPGRRDEGRYDGPRGRGPRQDGPRRGGPRSDGPRRERRHDRDSGGW